MQEKESIMKTKLLLIAMLLCVLFPVSSYSDFLINGGMMYDRNEKKAVLGACLDWPNFKLSENFSLTLGYSFSLNKNGFYTSAPGLLGIALIGLDISDSDDDDDSDDEDDGDGDSSIVGGIGVLLVIVPENIKFNYWLRPDFAFAVGLHPWGAEYDSSAEKFYYTNGISLDFKYIVLSRILISPYVSFRYVYKTDTPVYEAGLSLGIAF